MKVCTDACLFGALLSTIPVNNTRDFKALDIGTGTGLLSLMYAQKNESAIIDAVEIDEGAAKQAAENFATSPWSERLNTHNISIQQFSIAKKYDLIFTNPPFFERDLKSDDPKRNLALHSDALSLEELINVVDLLLKTQGYFAILLPCHRTDYFIELAMSKGFNLFQKILVKQTPNHAYFRSILFFTRTGIELVEREITITDDGRQYTPVFIELLKDYYLYL